MLFKDRLRGLLDAKGVKAAELAQKSGVSEGSISEYLSGKKEPLGKTAIKLANALSVSLDSLLGTPFSSTEIISHKKIRDHEDALSMQAQRIGRAYEKATPPVQRTVEVALEPYIEASAELTPDLSELEDEEEWEEVPIYNEAAAAGYGDYLSDSSYESISFPSGTVPDRTDYGVRINGNSMEPLIEDGSIVWVQAVSAVENGDIGIFVLDNCGYCKRLRVDYDRRQAHLESENDSYDDISIKEYNDFRTVGKVIGWIGPSGIGR